MELSQRKVGCLAALGVASLIMLMMILHQSRTPVENARPPDRESKSTYDLSGTWWERLSSSDTRRRADGDKGTASEILAQALSVLERSEPMGPEYRRRAYLRLSGERFALVSQPSAGGVVDSLIDLANASEISFIPAGSYSLAVDEDMIVYVEPKQIRVYRRDWPSMRLLEGSQLPTTETYESEAGASLNPKLSYTSTSLNIWVFSATESFQAVESGALQNAPLREIQFTLPN